MGLFYFAFSAFGFTVVMILSAIALFLFVVWAIFRHGRTALQITVAVAVFVVVQVLSFTILFHDFPKPSAVDITPLAALGNAHIADFEQKAAALEETRYFVKKNQYAYNYNFQFWQKPSVTMTIYLMEDAEEAYRNLLIAVGEDAAGEIEQLSDTVYVYRSASRMWRGRDTYFDTDLSRVADTYFMIDDILFLLHERGAPDVGPTTNEIIVLICETFLPAR